MERPALQGLLADIRAGRIDIVVIYRVGRLTRSLASFARLVEIFDAQCRVRVGDAAVQYNNLDAASRSICRMCIDFI
jgi:DNA invertase Pin-like site-specific DNA recombinase